MVLQIDHNISVDVVHVDHHDFGAMILLFMDLIRSASPQTYQMVWSS